MIFINIQPGNYIMQPRYLAIIAALTVAGCAKSPESIAPAYVSEVSYQNWTCNQLVEETSRVSAALAQASGQQENARTTDTVGVLLIGLPVSSLSGDNIAPQIAQLKGQTEAIHRATVTKNCGATAQAPSGNITTSSTR
jgi:hypothetical protein